MSARDRVLPRRARSLAARPHAVLGAAIAVMLTVGVVWPLLAGRVTTVIVSGESMLPTLHHGDLVVARKRTSYQVGDIVAYRLREDEVGAGVMVIHRVIGGSAEDGFVTRGDNREAQDVWRPTLDEVAGDVWFHVAGIGRVLMLLRTPVIVAALAAALTVAAVLGRENDDTVEQTSDDRAAA